MTAMSSSFASVDSGSLIAGELIDAVIEAVVLPPGPQARAAVICGLVHEMCAAVEWLPSGTSPYAEAAGDERVSLRQVAAAADRHLERMTMPQRQRESNVSR
jgi:hypothetical protein